MFVHTDFNIYLKFIEILIDHFNYGNRKKVLAKYSIVHRGHFFSIVVVTGIENYKKKKN